MNRGRIRIGRTVMYYPTTTEETKYGAGPFRAEITGVNADNKVSVTIHWPRPVAGYGTVDGTYGAQEQAVLESVTVDAKKTDVVVGGTAGQVSLFGH